MSDKQKQSVDSGGQAIQAGRDVTVGLTREDISEIVATTFVQINRFSQEAADKVEQRNAELRDELLEKIAESEERVREAFREPDYQHALGSAFRGYARKGSEELKKEISELLLKRAEAEDNDRVAEILNQAIEVLPRLSSADKSILVILFVCKNLTLIDASLDNIFVRYENILRPHVNGIPKGIGAFEYLDGIGCINVNLVADHFPLSQRFYERYTPYIPKKEVDAPPVPGHAQPKMEVPSMNEADFLKRLESVSPSFASLHSVWNDRLFPNTTLTSVGKAIAHSILESKGSLRNAPLEIFLALD